MIGLLSVREQEAMELVASAITLALDAAAVDPDLRRVLRPSELFQQLCAAEAALLGRPVEEVLAERSAQVPHGEGKLKTYEEWTKARAAEIEAEGVRGSHWPGKASDR